MLDMVLEDLGDIKRKKGVPQRATAVMVPGPEPLSVSGDVGLLVL